MWTLSLVAVAAARASEPAGGAEAAEAPVAEHGWVGLRMVGAGELGHGEAHSWVGPGIVLETHLVEHLLEIEVAAASLRSGAEREFPVEVLIEHVFHHGHAVEPFLGLGPLLVVGDAAEGPTLGAGGVVATGLHLWMTDQLGALLEADGVLTHREGWTPAVEASAGLMLRF